MEEVFFPIMTLSLFFIAISIGLNIVVDMYGLPFSTPGFSSSIIAATAVMSLYLAWKEFIHKNKVYLEYDWQFEEPSRDENAKLVLTNTSDRIVRLNYINFSYASWERENHEEDSLRFRNNEMVYFDDKTLEPGESTEKILAKNLILFDAKELPVRNWKGEKVDLENNLAFLERTLQRTDISPEELRHNSPKIRKIYEEVKEIDHDLGTRFKVSDIKEKTAEELMSIHKE